MTKNTEQMKEAITTLTKALEALMPGAANLCVDIGLLNDAFVLSAKALKVLEEEIEC